MDSSSPKRQSGLRVFNSKVALWKSKNKVSSKQYDAGGHATNPEAPADNIPDGTPEDRGDPSTCHSLAMTEELSGSMRQIENILRSMHSLALSIDYHSYACSDMAHQMRLLSDMVGEPNDRLSNSHSGTKRGGFLGSPSDGTSLIHARCASHSAAFWEKQSAIQESVRLSIANLYQRINEDAKGLFKYQAREDDKVKKFLSDLEMGAFKSPHTNYSDTGACDTVAEQILRIRFEVMYSWSRKREANFSALNDDLVRSFAVGTTLAGSRAFRKAQKTFGAFQEMVYLLPDALRQDLDPTSSGTDDNFQDSSSSVRPVEGANTLRERAAKVMAKNYAYAQQRAASTRDIYARFHASQRSASNLELPPDHLDLYHRMTGDPELDSSSPESKQVHLASEAPRSLTNLVQHHSDTDFQREQRGWRHPVHDNFDSITDRKVSFRDHSRPRMRDTRQDTHGSATQQRTLRRLATTQSDIMAYRPAISVDEDRISSRLLTSVGALETAHGAVKELEVKRIRHELASLANSAQESGFRASETFLSKPMGTDPTSYHSIDLKPKLLRQLSTATDRRPPSSLAVEVSSMGPPRSIVIHLGPEQMDGATVRRMLEEAETNMEKGTTGKKFGINTIRNCLAPAFKRRQVQVLVESACRQICFDDASDSAYTKPHKRRASMVLLQGGSILKRTGKFIRENNGKFHITEPCINNSKWEPGDSYLPRRIEFEIALDELYSTNATHSPPENRGRPSKQLRDRILASIYGYQDRETRSRAKAQHLTKNLESNIKGIEALRCWNEWLRREGIGSNHQSKN